MPELIEEMKIFESAKNQDVIDCDNILEIIESESFVNWTESELKGNN